MMVCRCSSPAEHAQREASAAYESAAYSEREAKKREASLRAQIDAMTPDSTRFEIIDVLAVGSALVLKVLFPNCAKCAYEGTKVLVYLNVSTVDALKWRRLDPHFRPQTGPKVANEAPSPDARFPASPAGWADATVYAHGKDVAKSKAGVR